MPSEVILKEKQQQVADMIARLNGAASGVLVDYKGISVADDTKLRVSLREAGVEYTVVKNSILRFACKEAGLPELEAYLSGTTALATSKEDLTAPANILQKYADQSRGKFTLKAGFVEGEFLDTAGVTALAKLPNKETLLTQLAFALSGLMRNFAVVIDQIRAAKEEGGEAPAVEEAPAAVAEAPAEA